MRIVDSHFHWYPRPLMELLCRRSSGYPRAIPDGKGAYKIQAGTEAPISGGWAQWYDLDALFAHENSQGYEVDVVCSTGPMSALFSCVPDPRFGLELPQVWKGSITSCTGTISPAGIPKERS